jgi:serine protease Do
MEGAMKPRRASLFLCGTLCTAALFPAAVPARDQDEDPLVRLYDRLAPATVLLSVSYETSHPLSYPSTIGVGAGFIVDEAGTLLTNAHVVDGADSIIATLYNGERVIAKLLALDPADDVAILQLPPATQKYPTVKLGDSDHLRIGQKTIVVGSPFGLGFTLTNGIISGLGPSAGSRGSAPARVIQTTAPINPGNSGGPLVDSRGRVIGLTTAVLMGAQNIGFAIPINIAKQVLAEFRDEGTITRPWLGIGGMFPTDQMRELFALPMVSGLLVEDVEDGSPASEAGLRSGTLNVTIEGFHWVLGGDILVAVNGYPTRDAGAFRDTVKSLHPGQRVQIEFLRNGERTAKSVLLRERPRGSLRSKQVSNQQMSGLLSRGLPWMPDTQLTVF